MKTFLLALFLTLIPILCYAWDCEDQDSGDSIEIDKGQLVRRGNNIEFFDYGDNSYHSGDIEDIRKFGSTVEIEITDDETGKTRILEMD